MHEIGARRLGAAALLGAALIAAPPAWAGGYNLLPRGARSLGRGGAFVASADDLSAAWLNPARLAALRGVQVLADLGMVHWDVDFQRAADAAVAPGGFALAENMAPPVWSPSVFLGWDFGLDWFEATIGFYGPYAGDLGFDSTGPQRYTLVYLDMFYAIYQVAVAFRPVRWLAIGAAFQIQDIRMTEAVKLSAYTGFDPLGGAEDPSNDILVELDVASHVNPSGLFGLWAAPADWVDLGLSVQLPVSVEADGTVAAWLPSDNALLRDAWIDGDRVTVRLDNAMVIRAGVGFRLPRRFELEVDAWAEVWEPHRAIATEVHDVVLRDVEGDMDIALADIVVRQDWRSSFGAAAGVEWEVLERRLRLRLGLFYDSSAIPDRTLSVAWYDAHKVALCFGLTVEFWRMAIDVGYAHLFYVPRAVDDSAVTQINPLEPPSEALLSVVGNGSYEASADSVGLTLRAQFDTPRWGRRRRAD
jgi:long-chain fatty acid transport protein